MSQRFLGSCLAFALLSSLTMSAACTKSEPDGPPSDAPPSDPPPSDPPPSDPPPSDPPPSDPPPSDPPPSDPPPSTDCDGQPCAAPKQCIQYYGIAGPSGPSFHACEQPCKRGKGNDGCPEGTRCVTIADGPGDVCR